MKNKVSIPTAFAAVWMLIQLLLFSLKIPGHFMVGIYLNLLFILGVIIISMFVQIRNEKKLYPFATNFKNSLKKSGMYMIIITAFLFCYFKFINPAFLTDIADARIEAEMAKDWNKVQESSPIFKDMTKDEYIEKAIASNELLSSVSLNLSFYFLGMFLMSVFYSILVPLFYKKVVLRM